MNLKELITECQKLIDAGVPEIMPVRFWSETDDYWADIVELSCEDGDIAVHLLQVPSHDPAYVPLYVGNEWMVTYFARSGLKYTPKLSERFNFKEGEKVRIMWPSGEFETVTIEMQTKTGTYGDHGHEYPYVDKRAGFTKNIQGVPTWFFLGDFYVHNDDICTAEAQSHPPKKTA